MINKSKKYKSNTAILLDKDSEFKPRTRWKFFDRILFGPKPGTVPADIERGGGGKIFRVMSFGYSWRLVRAVFVYRSVGISYV